MGLVSTPLFEREAELAQLERVLDRAAAGAGSFTAIEGEAGIGKTRLLQAAAAHAHECGLPVLTARGAELERPFAFGVVRQLLEPALRSLSKAQRRTVLGGVARLGGRLLEGDAGGDRGPPPDVFSLVHSLFWICAGLVEDGPLVLLVDDAHWADDESLLWLSYLAPRVEELAVAVVVAARPMPAAAWPSGPRIPAGSAPAPIRPHPLGAKATAALVRTGYGTDVDVEFAQACHEVTRGNPFLAAELVRALRTDGVPPTAAHADRVRDARPATISRSILARLAALGPAAVATAEALAVLGDPAELRLVASLAGLPPTEASAAVDTLGAAGILAAERPIAFIHPLVRAMLYDDLPAGRRAAAHRRAADLLAGEDATAEQVATHLLRSEPAGDPGVVVVLRAAAAGARSRGALTAAIAHLERALREPPTDADLAPTLLELGSAERLARGSGIEHLQRALDLLVEPVERAQVARELAVGLTAAERGLEAWGVLEHAIADLENRDQELALRLEADLLGLGQTVLALAPRVTARIEAQPLPSGATPGERLVLANAGHHLAVQGAVRDGAEAVRVAWRGGKLLHEQTADAPTIAWAMTVIAGAEDLELFDEMVEQSYADARSRGSVLGFAVTASVQASTFLARGQVVDAEATARDGLDAAFNAGWRVGVPVTTATLVAALLERGALEEAAGWIERLGFTRDLPELTLFNHLLAARAALRLAERNRDEGIADLFELGRREKVAKHARWQHPWRSALAPELAAAGHREEAEALAAEDVEIARRRGTLRPLGMALRSLGIVSEEPRRTELLREAVATLEGSFARLEYARALADLGAALRRANNRSAAREPLRLALDLAHRSGAARLRDRIGEELAATGARSRSVVLSGLDALTASERRVADLAASGLSNPEIAQALFISRKTVETHLRSTYMKLGIRSRDELPGALMPAAD